MHLLLIAYVWPEPESSAAGAHVMQLIERFRAQHWQVTVASPAAKTEYSRNLSVLGLGEQAIRLNCDSFDSWIKQLQPDIVLFDRFMMEEQFGWRVAHHCPQALRVLETSDLHSLRQARQQLLKAGLAAGHTHPPLSTAAELYSAMASEELTQREIAAIYRCDLTLLLSDVEKKLLVEQFGVPQYLLHYCPFMLDAVDNKQRLSFADRQHFVSIGNFLHSPNWDSVLWLQQQIWPLIRQQLPQAQVFVYGAYAPPKALALHQPAQGFHVPGRAGDACAVLEQARVCLAPLRFGAGIKGKLADAMRCGTPSVTTSIGSEAMACGDQWGGLVANTADELARAAVRLYQDPVLWQQAQHDGDSLLLARFDKQKIGSALMGQLQDALQQREQRRLANFTGLLLQHQAHRSTEYMARWIEAKNKLPPPKPPGL